MYAASMTPLLPSEFIREMKATHVQRGWVQNIMEDEYGHLCLVGARLVTSKGLSLLYPEIGIYNIAGAALGSIADAIGINRTELVEWNDHPHRTFNDLIDIYDKAEKLALIAEEGS